MRNHAFLLYRNDIRLSMISNIIFNFVNIYAKKHKKIAFLNYFFMIVKIDYIYLKLNSTNSKNMNVKKMFLSTLNLWITF